MIAECGKVSDVFVNPQSDIARELILPKSKVTDKVQGKRMLRIVFDGEESGMPVISNLVISSGVAVNIMFADTKDIDGKAFGQMLLQIPDGDRSFERVTAYLDSIDLKYSEEVG